MAKSGKISAPVGSVVYVWPVGNVRVSRSTFKKVRHPTMTDPSSWRDIAGQNTEERITRMTDQTSWRDLADNAIPATQQHGCQFSWCTSELANSDEQRFEHYQLAESIPTTVYRSAEFVEWLNRNNEPVTYVITEPCHLLVGCHMNEDDEDCPFPIITLDEDSEDHVQYRIRVDEALLLYNALGRAIANACEGAGVDTSRLPLMIVHSRPGVAAVGAGHAGGASWRPPSAGLES